MTNEIRKDLKYTNSHEWIKIKKDIAIVGITDHAQSELTDIVFAELPSIGKMVQKGEELCVVESVKSVSEIYSPISGEIIKINKKLEDSPEIINEDPYDEGWLVELSIKDRKDIDDLLSPEEYKKIIE
jgi:glycine cleavage system H protein